uniref:Eukaryotic translation initiation factor 3 subunit C n=1 Tax=Tetradesmus obliquus TaxID=3088 RepID=A0A383WAN8_TETOB
MKINDWSAIQGLFDELNKRLERARKVSEAVGTPRVYVRMCVELEDFLNDTLANKDLKKKMSPTNAKALNTMRQRLKKHNTSDEFAEAVTKFRENPQEDEEEEEEEEESSSSSSESDADGAREETEKRPAGAAKKKDKLLTMDSAEITYEMVAKKLREIVTSRGRKGTDKQEQKLREIVTSRGRKGTDKQEQVEMLQFLANVAKGVPQKLEVLLQLVGSLFDLSPGISNYMKVGLWKRCMLVMLEIMDTLQANETIVLDDSAEPSEERTAEPVAGEDGKVRVWGNLVAFVERLDDEMFKSLQVIDPHTHEYMARLRDEPVFLALSQKVHDYLARIGDVRNQPKVALRLIEHFYYKTDAVYDAMRKLTMLQQEEAAASAAAHPEGAVAAASAAAETAAAANTSNEPGEEQTADDKVALPVPLDFSMDESSTAAMKRLVGIVFTHGDERAKARAMLCTIYHKALHGDFHSARDMLLMSHLQDNVMLMDISTQILYNRSMAQLGLAAFRLGLISEAHSCLQELYGSGHIKELLAQGMAMGKFQDKTPEQELLEKRRQMPFHMHISLELLESSCLISAMLLEVPAMASSPLSVKKRVISKSFHRILDTYNRQTFTGPPETVRDHIMAATRALMRGDWSGAYGAVSALTVWQLVPQRESVLDMLRKELKEEALRTYLFSYSAQYRSLSLDQLCTMFEMDEKAVYSIVSKMMIAEELHGSWDQPTRTIVMHSIEATKVQSLAGQFADKATLMVELNERAYAFRTGGRRGQDGQWEDDGGHGGRGRGRGPRLGAARMGLGQGGQDFGGHRRGGGGGGRGDRGGFRASGFSSNMTSGLPDRFQRRGPYRQQANPNMQALGSISRPGGGVGGGPGGGSYNRPLGGDRRDRGL